MTFAKKVFLLFIFLMSPPVSGRDINLDTIYLENSCPSLHRLVEARLEAYKQAGARFIDRQVIFVHWLSSTRLVYLKEYPGITIIYQYDLQNSHRKELCRLSGTVTTSSLTTDRRFLVCKLLSITSQNLPSQELCIVNCTKGRKTLQPSGFPFKDFSFASSGEGIIMEKSKGFVLIYPGVGISRLLLPRNTYFNLLKSQNPRILLLSPDGLKKLVLAGSGGSYRSLLITQSGTKTITGLTSASEIFWLNNEEILYRSGGTGYFNVEIRNIITDKKTRIHRNTLNSGISFSQETDTIAFLDNQIITLFEKKKNSPVITGLEGDDVSFNPDGSSFATLLYSRCFIVRKSVLYSNLERLKPSIKRLLNIYTDLAREKHYFANQYSLNYCMRKTASYINFLKH